MEDDLEDNEEGKEEGEEEGEDDGEDQNTLGLVKRHGPSAMRHNC